MALGLVVSPAEHASGQEWRVLVTPSMVRVTIPVDSATFRWNQATTPDNVLEYEWQVAVASGEDHYTFGFSLFKHAHTAPQLGDLRALLSAGQANVWLVTDSGGTTLPGWQISITPQPHAVEIVVQGPDAVKTLFGALPRAVSVRSLTQGRRSDRQVIVEYQSP
jgi:hypothetical protein